MLRHWFSRVCRTDSLTPLPKLKIHSFVSGSRSMTKSTSSSLPFRSMISTVSTMLRVSSRYCAAEFWLASR